MTPPNCAMGATATGAVHDFRPTTVFNKRDDKDREVYESLTYCRRCGLVFKTEVNSERVEK